jgi:hypothetical protein
MGSAEGPREAAHRVGWSVTCAIRAIIVAGAIEDMGSRRRSTFRVSPEVNHPETDDGSQTSVKVTEKEAIQDIINIIHQEQDADGGEVGVAEAVRVDAADIPDGAEGGRDVFLGPMLQGKVEGCHLDEVVVAADVAKVRILMALQHQHGVPCPNG